MKTIKFYNIDWDTTDDTHPKGQKVKLPKEVTLTVEDDEFDPEMEGADLLSDNYGWCVNGFDFEII